jgi:hypothetical protein
MPASASYVQQQQSSVQQQQAVNWLEDILPHACQGTLLALLHQPVSKDTNQAPQIPLRHTSLSLCNIRHFCIDNSFMMEYDIHTILDGMTLLATVGVLYALWFTPIKTTYQADLDNVKFYYVVRYVTRFVSLQQQQQQRRQRYRVAGQMG